LDKAGLPASEDIAWEVPREESHGDYATNSALALARTEKKAPRQIAEAIKTNFPHTPMVMKLEVAGQDFSTSSSLPTGAPMRSRAFSPTGRPTAPVRRDRASASCSSSSRRIQPGLSSSSMRGRPRWAMRSRASFARRGHGVECQFYVNDAGNQLQALRALRRRETPPGFGRGGRAARGIPIRANTSWIWWRSGSPPTPRPCRALAALPEAERIERLGRMAVTTSSTASGPCSRPTARGSTRGRTSRPTCGPGAGPSAPSRSSRPPATPTSRMAPSGSLDNLRRRQGPRPAQVGR